MHYQALHAELRARLAALSVQITASCAQGLTDLPKHAEDLVAGLLRELMGYRNIRNLNARGSGNFPGLDLADDEKHIGFQVTATPTLEKIKDTLAIVLRHRLYEKYPQFKMVILTEKQASYSQAAIDNVLDGKMLFDCAQSILDYRDFLNAATHASPVAIRRALDVLDAYERGALDALASADFDPPAVTEGVELNLLEIYFPRTLYVADLLDRPKARSDARKHVRTVAEGIGLRLPSDYEVAEGKLITFYNLEESINLFEGLYDRGTLTTLAPEDFSCIDQNQERVFKSLLRLCLQQQLYRHRVHWRYEDKLFVFLPWTDEKLMREERWTDKRTDTRTVVLYKASKRDPSKGGFRHLAFQVDFLTTDDDWLMAIRPDWYFSTHPNYRPSPIGPDLLKGIKRLETNKSVEQHFRFLWRWLQDVTEGDLLSQRSGFLSFGDIKTFDNHPALDDKRWLPPKAEESLSEATEEFADLLLGL